MANDSPPDPEDYVVEDMLMGPSGYGTNVVRSSPDSSMPYTIWIMGPDLSLPYMLQCASREVALRGADAIRDVGLHPFLRGHGHEPKLPSTLREDLLYGLKLAARARRPGVVSMQKDMGLEALAPDVFVETWIHAVANNPEGSRTLINFALMATLELTYQDDPERALRAIVDIPTLNRAEKSAAKDKLAEYLHYKTLPDKLKRELNQSQPKRQP